MEGSDICNFLGTVSFILNLILKIRRNVHLLDCPPPPPPNLFFAELVLLNKHKQNKHFCLRFVSSANLIAEYKTG
jgi:hypothetical protein